MKLLNINCRSVVNKSTELEGLIIANDPDIVILTETWLSDEIYDSEFVPSGYRVYRKDRGSRGGGVCIIYKSALNVFLMPEVAYIECLFCKAYSGGLRYIVGAMYRPPNSDASTMDVLKEYLCDHVKPDDRIILSGDFNLPDVDWLTMSPKIRNDKVGEAMLDIAFAFDLTQVVEGFTRIQDSSKTLLDLFFVSGSIFENATSQIMPGISDHQAVFLSLSNVKVDKANEVSYFRNFSRADDEAIIDVLSFHLDNFSRTDANVHNLWASFTKLIHECIEQFVPLIRKKNKRVNAWISRSTIHLQRKLKRLKKKRRSVGDCVNLESKISDLSHKVKTQVAADKDKYFSVSLPSFITSSPQKFWQAISPSYTDVDAFTINGVQITDATKIANAFNRQFQSCFTNDDGKLPNFVSPLPPMPDITVSEKGIFNMLLKLDVKKSSGADEIPNAFLKRYAEWVAKYLCILFTKSLKEGQLPIDWRTAKVKPLHKKGKKDEISNYRPISLLSTVCKLLEHIVHNHISEFLTAHNALSESQHGFRRGYSTCTQLVQTVYDFALTINNGEQTDAIFMDFSKAFDKVSHKKLIFKLDNILKNKQLTKWILSYLHSRQQYVVFKDKCSERVSVESGVPQGSVLGPLLFLLYINDIVNDIPVNIKLYADDCVIYSEVKNSNDQIKLNAAFQKVKSWCDSWQMPINFEKTVFMRISHKKEPLLFQYCCNNIYLAEVQYYKYLGVYITNNLTWNKHIDYVAACANTRLSFLRRVLKHSTPTVRLLAYKSTVLPILDYAVVIWDPFTLTNKKKIEKIQRKAARFIYNSYGRTSVSALLARANLPPITERNRISRLKFLYQLIKKHYKIDTSKLLSFSSGYPTRHRHNLSITPFQTRNNCFTYSFFPRTVGEWNNLTNDVVLQPSLEKFALCLTA